MCPSSAGKECIKNVGRVKSPLSREKSPLGREKSPAPVFLLRVTNFQTAKPNSKVFQLVFAFLRERSKWPCLDLMPCIGHSPKWKIWETKDSRQESVGCATALFCCQTVALQFGEVFQTSKPSFTHRSEGIWWKDCPIFGLVYTFSLENIEIHGEISATIKKVALITWNRKSRQWSGKVAF